MSMHERENRKGAIPELQGPRSGVMLKIFTRILVLIRHRYIRGKGQGSRKRGGEIILTFTSPKGHLKHQSQDLEQEVATNVPVQGH